MGSEGPVCPACGQPVETVVQRHKTLGAWVPVWVAGPCRNPECGACEAEEAEGGRTGEDSRAADSSRSAEDTAPPRSADDTAPPATTPHDDAFGETVAKNS